MLVCMLSLVVCVSCRTSSETTAKTPDEIALAQSAVREILDMGLQTAAMSVSWPEGTQLAVSDFTPDEAIALLQDLDTIPGTRKLFTRYLEQVTVAANLSVKELAVVIKPFIAGLDIPDPFAIIDGGSTAATNYFLEQMGARLDTALTETLGNRMSGFPDSAVDCWKRFESLYNTYAEAKTRLATATGGTAFTIIEINPMEKAIDTVKKAFIAGMADHEEMVRATAASYDSPALDLFIISDRK